jgi:hypothetical protein
MEYLTALIGLAGVVIGGFLTPVLTSRIEDRRIKKSIRPQLIEKIYVFFNLRKAHISVSNFHNFKVQLMRFAALEKIKQGDSTAEPKRTLAIQTILDTNDPTSQQLKSEQYFEQLVEIESKIIALICQTQQYYGKEIYKKLNNLIKPEIDKSNQPNNLYQYSKLSHEQLQKVAQTIENDISEEIKKLNSPCDTLISEVMTILA